LFSGRSNDFCGECLVTSLWRFTEALRRPALVGLYLRMAMVGPVYKPVSMIGFCLSPASVLRPGTLRGRP